MNLIISLAQFKELCALQSSIIITLANEVQARLTIVPALEDQTIESVLQTAKPIRNKTGQYGQYAEGQFVVNDKIAAVLPNGPRSSIVVFNDGKPQELVSNANPLSIRYKAQVGITKNNKAHRFGWDIVICETVADDVGYKFRVTSVEGHVFSLVIAKDANGKIKEIEYTKY
jgi:hypothetical protein